MKRDDQGTPPVSQNRGIAIVALSTVMWGTGGLFVRLMPFDLWTLMFWRSLFGMVFIGAVLLYRYGSAAPAKIRHLDRNGLFVVACSTAMVFLFVAGVQFTSVANAFTILAALPFFAAAISWLWLGERPSGMTMLASAIALVGIIIMLRPTGGGPRLGDLFAILGTAAQGLVTVVIRRSRNMEILPVAWLSVVLCVVIAFPLAEDFWLPATKDYVVAALYGLIPLTCGQVLYMVGSTLISPTLSALIGTLEAPIGTLWAWIGVGEVPARSTFIGGSIVFGSVFGRLLVEQLSMRKSRAGQA